MAVDPASNFIGIWELAAAEVGGLTMVGDFSQGADLFGDMRLSVFADGTGNIVMSDESEKFTWELSGDDAIVLKSEGSEDPLTATYDDGVLSFEMNTDEYSGRVYFTQDGSYGDFKVITAADGKTIASEDELVGAWNISAVSMYGMTMYGDPASFKAMGLTDESSATVTFEAGGTCTIFGSSVPWRVDSTGAAIASDEGESPTIPILASGDSIIVDCTEMMGEEGEFLMVFSK